MQRQRIGKALILCPLLCAVESFHAPLAIVARRSGQRSQCASIASRTYAIAALVALLGMVSGCVDTPSRVPDIVREGRFQEDIVQGTTFRHRVFRREGRAGPSGTLHIYIEGDGRPFIAHTLVSAD